MILLLILLSILPFLPALRGAFILDDTAMIRCLRFKIETMEKYPNMSRWGWDVHHWNYDPRRITFLTHYWTLYLDMWFRPKSKEISPASWHIGNYAIHAGCVLLAWNLLTAFGGLLSASEAAMAVLVFAVHPLQVPSVGYISARAGMLAGFFVLCSLNLLFVVFNPFMAILAGWFALKCKEDAVILPPLALALGVFLWAR